MKGWGVLALLPLLAACAQHNLDMADASVPTRNTATLEELRGDALALARAYAAAARKTGRLNDIGSYATVAAAGATVAGAVASASGTALANRALAGIATSTVTKREAGKTSIQAMYAGARSLNCIASVAGIGATLIGTAKEREAAAFATAGAIEYAKLSVRDGTVQDVADFSSVFTDFQKAVTDAMKSRGSVTTSAAPMTATVEEIKAMSLDQYLTILGVCTDKAKAPVVTPAAAPAAGAAANTPAAGH